MVCQFLLLGCEPLKGKKLVELIFVSLMPEMLSMLNVRREDGRMDEDVSEWLVG